MDTPLRDLERAWKVNRDRESLRAYATRCRRMGICPECHGSGDGVGAILVEETPRTVWDLLGRGPITLLPRTRPYLAVRPDVYEALMKLVEEDERVVQGPGGLAVKGIPVVQSSVLGDHCFSCSGTGKYTDTENQREFLKRLEVE